MALISLHDLRLVSDALQSLRGATIGGAVMRGDLRQLLDEVSNQLEVRFENA